MLGTPQQWPGSLGSATLGICRWTSQPSPPQVSLVTRSSSDEPYESCTIATLISIRPCTAVDASCIRDIVWTSAVEEHLLIAGAMTSSCGTLFTWGGNFSGKGTSHRGALGTGDEAGRMLPTRQYLSIVVVV